MRVKKRIYAWYDNGNGNYRKLLAVSRFSQTTPSGFIVFNFLDHGSLVSHYPEIKITLEARGEHSLECWPGMICSIYGNSAINSAIKFDKKHG